MIFWMWECQHAISQFQDARFTSSILSFLEGPDVSTVFLHHDDEQEPLSPPEEGKPQVDVGLLVHPAIQAQERLTSQDTSEDHDDVQSATDCDQQPLPPPPVMEEPQVVDVKLLAKPKRDLLHGTHQKVFSLIWMVINSHCHHLQ